MNVINQTISGLETLNVWIRSISRGCILFMIFVTFLVVILRYLFDTGWVWMQESVIYAHSFVFLLSIGPTLSLDRHVRVDIFYEKRTPRQKAVINIFGSVIFLIPTCILIFIQSYPYVLSSWSVFEGSKDSGGLDFVYIQKTFILLFCIVTLLQSLRMILIAMQEIRAKRQ